ncbi:MAG: hypothetical protein HDT28_06020 [Clostridiales bacterium]|nr:hypothetical protein [Clostridiales bacterium]
MAFKNALKNLVAHFGIVWALLLYIVIFTAIIVGLSLPFLLPIANAFARAGVFEGIGAAFSAMFGEGGWNGLWSGLYEVYSEIVSVFESNSRYGSLLMTFLIFVVIVAFRFLFGLHEIPLATVLDGRMSSNAQFGLGGKFFSTLWTSARYSLAKMPITIAFDAITAGILYGCIKLFGLSVWLPFALILVIIVFSALKSAMLACWAPCVVNGYGVIKGFAKSVEICFKKFGSMYSTYFVTWLLMVAVGTFVTVFTLGVGILIALPFVTALLGHIGITEYYNKTGKRYYIDGVVFTPPVVEQGTSGNDR